MVPEGQHAANEHYVASRLVFCSKQNIAGIIFESLLISQPGLQSIL